MTPAKSSPAMSTPVRTMASVASIPQREKPLQLVVERLLPQVDRLNVYLNGYRHTPMFLQQPGIFIAHSTENGDVGDAGKFFWLGTSTQYFLTCDDDILYPYDYVARTVAAIDKYDRRAVVGWQGSILGSDFEDYYANGSRRILSFYSDLNRDTPVHILGTGTVGFHVSAFDIGFSDFRSPNMADIWFGLKAQQQAVPFIALRHRTGDLVPISMGSQETAIWRDCVQNAGSRLDTRALQNSTVKANWPWIVYDPPVARSRRPLIAALEGLLALRRSVRRI